MNIAFFCASSEKLSNVYYQTTSLFADKVIEKNWKIISGGANIGLMKILAQTAKKYSAQTIGIIPREFSEKNLVCFDNSTIILTENLQERKKKLIELADAFVVLPGGFGTLDEFFETLTLKLLGEFDKPIVLLNVNNFYDNLIKQIDLIFKENFADYTNKNSFFTTPSVDKAIEYIENYKK